MNQSEQNKTVLLELKDTAAKNRGFRDYTDLIAKGNGLCCCDEVAEAYASQQTASLQKELEEQRIQLSNYAYQMDMAKRDRDKAEAENERFKKQVEELSGEVKRLKSSLSASERFRLSDAGSAILEANQLRDKIKEQELIIHGIEEGSREWELLANDRLRQIEELQAKNERLTAYLKKIEDVTALANVGGQYSAGVKATNALCKEALNPQDNQKEK